RSRITASIREAIKSKAEHWSGEYRFRHAKGHYLQLLERALLVRDKNGRAVRFVGVLMDVTARKQLRDQLSHSQKMEAFGQLAGGVAHDFNNFLTAILGYSDLLVSEIPGRGTGAKYLSEIRSAAGRAASLTRQLLTFSRREPLEPRILEVNMLIHNLERSILRLLGENISVLCELMPEKKHIKVDPDQFTQIIINLAVNARDAMPAGGTLVLKTETISTNGKSLPELPSGKYVDISVRHVAVRTLRMLGYNVLEAFRADEAKRLIENTAINLVVSDIVLPDMSGCDFADWMRINSPSTQILLTSGYLPEMTTIGTPSSDLPFLSKPFDPQQLAETVRASLDAVVLT